MRNFIIAIWYILYISCHALQNQSTKLKGTVWECKITEDCVNTYKFMTDSTFKFLSCEMQDEYYGVYFFMDGFLMLDEKGSVYDKNLPDSSADKAERKLYKVAITGNKLKHLSMSDWIDGKWIQSNYKFNEDYLYKKIKSK
jgi:hypothetical protein